jgi:hypothetical protein
MKWTREALCFLVALAIMVLIGLMVCEVSVNHIDDGEARLSVSIELSESGSCSLYRLADPMFLGGADEAVNSDGMIVEEAAHAVYTGAVPGVCGVLLFPEYEPLGCGPLVAESCLDAGCQHMVFGDRAGDLPESGPKSPT